MSKAQAMNLKGLSSSCCGHSALMQLRPLYCLVCNQVSMQQASKIVLYQCIIQRQHVVGLKKN